MAYSIWTHNELIVAFNLYCKIPFGRIHIHNPQIITLAKAIDRTPSAVSWKLANFARLDPSLKKRGIEGADHGFQGKGFGQTSGMARARSFKELFSQLQWQVNIVTEPIRTGF